jgi:peptidase E
MRLFLASKLDCTIDLALQSWKLAANKLKAIYIPTAHNCSPTKQPVETRGSFTCLVQRDVQTTVIDLEETNHTRLATALACHDAVVVAGGNPFYLLFHMKRSGFVHLVRPFLEQGGYYLGSSAGACVCSPNLGYIRSSEDSPDVVPELMTYDALGLVDVQIFPHCVEPWFAHNYPAETIQEMLRTNEKKILLRDTQALLVQDDWYRIVAL